MNRLVILGGFLALVLTGVSAQTSEGLFVEVDAAVGSTASLGLLSEAIRPVPLDAGPEALLTPADLSDAGGASTPQTVLRNQLDVSVAIGASLPDTILELRLSGTVVHSPGGYYTPLFGAAAPGVSGVTITRFPRAWDGGVLDISLGRLQLQDPSGFVVDQLVDGAGLALRFPRTFVHAAVGNTRWVDRYFYTPRLVSADADVYGGGDVLAPERIIGLLRVEYGPFFGQTVGLHASFYDDRIAGPGTQAAYTGLAASGTIIPGLSHATSIILRFLTGEASPGLIANVEARYEFASLPLGLDANLGYASGSNGPLGSYLAISPQAIVPGLGLVHSGVQWFGVGADAVIPLGLTGEPLEPQLDAVILLDAESADPWVGVEINGSIDYQILSDVLITALAGVSQSDLGWTPHFSLSGRVEL